MLMVLFIGILSVLVLLFKFAFELLLKVINCPNFYNIYPFILEYPKNFDYISFVVYILQLGMNSLNKVCLF